jgi:hypothetical protein
MRQGSRWPAPLTKASDFGASWAHGAHVVRRARVALDLAAIATRSVADRAAIWTDHV